MNIWILFKKNILEQFRDFWPLIITLIASPFFVFLYWMMFSGGMNSLSIGIVNLDRGFREKSYSKEWIEILKTQKKNEFNVFQITDVKDREVLKNLLKEKKIHAGFVLPEDFSEILEKSKSGKLENTIQAEMTGDMTNPMYLVGVTLVILEMESFAYKIAKVKKFIQYNETFSGSSGTKNDFEMAVPGLIVFSIIMLLFTSTIAFIREIEERTILRIQLAPISTFEYFIGIGLAQFLIGVVSVGFTMGAAILFGFKFQGSNLSIFLPIVLCILSIQGTSLIVASFCRNGKDVLTIGNIPLFILMWFSGSMYPFPKNELFRIGDFPVSWNDFLPPTHAVNAMNKVFNFGANLNEIGFEIIALIILTLIYSGIGIILFQKRQMR
jgi:ABC-2 type transport system permease protein